MYIVCNNFVTQHTKLLQFFGTFLFGLSIGIALIKVLCLFSVINFNPKQYVYVDIEKVIDSVNSKLKQQIEQKQINETQVSAQLIQAKNNFNTSLDNYVNQHNAVVFSSSKVIAGANNVTEYFREQALAGIE